MLGRCVLPALAVLIGLTSFPMAAGAKTVAIMTGCTEDLVCRHYGFGRRTADYAMCRTILAAYGLGPAISNGYTISYDPLRKLPPKACRVPARVEVW